MSLTFVEKSAAPIISNRSKWSSLVSSYVAFPTHQHLDNVLAYKPALTPPLKKNLERIPEQSVSAFFNS